MENEFVLQMKDINKSFPGVRALKDVNLNVRKGTIHALMGENGAGKSTLMKILIGLYQPDKGEIIYKGKRLVMNGPRDALNSGISMIHQEINPLLDMTVSANIFLGREPLNKTGLVNERKLAEDTKKLFESLDINDISPNMLMRELSVAQMQK